MEQITKTSPMVLDGALGVILVGISDFIFRQRFVLIQDRDDRKTGTGIRKHGLPGGGIETEKNETPKIAFIREVEEEIAEKLANHQPEQIGCFTKLRPNGYTNKNYLFRTVLDKTPKCTTNDPDEVSKVVVYTLEEIIQLAQRGEIHEGSIRLIFHFLNETTSGSLDCPVSWNGYKF